MRITRETLIKLAQETVTERTRISRGIVSAYAAGSLLTQDPLLGGTTDIDLFFIHDSEPVYHREFVRLSPDIHLDIYHHSQNLYRQPRHLRTDLWLGSTLYYNPILMHDTQHWFEFTQASVRSLFWQADNVMRRVRPLAETAREDWVKLQNSSLSMVGKYSLYLHALEAGVNAIASLNGAPLPGRRFLQLFPERAKEVESPGLSAGLMGLLGAAELDANTIHEWLPAWKEAFETASQQENTPPDLNPARLAYFERGIEALLASSSSQTAIWPLLNTWTQSLSVLLEDSPNQIPWQQACATLGFGAETIEDRVSGLDAYLDQIEETLEKWASANGAESSG